MKNRSYFPFPAVMILAIGMAPACGEEDSQSNAALEGAGGNPFFPTGTGGFSSPRPGRGPIPGSGNGGAPDDGLADCVAEFCTPVSGGTPCCVSVNGPCGADFGNGCVGSEEPGGGRGGFGNFTGSGGRMGRGGRGAGGDQGTGGMLGAGGAIVIEAGPPVTDAAPPVIDASQPPADAASDAPSPPRD